MKMRSILVIMTILCWCCESHSQAGELRPCDAAILMSEMELQLSARVARDLGMAQEYSREKELLFRIVVLPDFVFGQKESDSEWMVSVFLFEEEDAVLELSKAKESIRGANTILFDVSEEPGLKRVNLRKKHHRISAELYSAKIDRATAIFFRKYILEKLNLEVLEHDDIVEMNLHSPDYLFIVRKGRLICRQASFSTVEQVNDPLCRLTQMLRNLATSDKDGRQSVLDEIVAFVQEEKTDISRVSH